MRHAVWLLLLNSFFDAGLCKHASAEVVVAPPISARCTVRERPFLYSAEGYLGSLCPSPQVVCSLIESRLSGFRNDTLDRLANTSLHVERANESLRSTLRIRDGERSIENSDCLVAIEASLTVLVTYAGDLQSDERPARTREDETPWSEPIPPSNNNQANNNQADNNVQAASFEGFAFEGSANALLSLGSLPTLGIGIEGNLSLRFRFLLAGIEARYLATPGFVALRSDEIFVHTLLLGAYLGAELHNQFRMGIVGRAGPLWTQVQGSSGAASADSVYYEIGARADFLFSASGISAFVGFEVAIPLVNLDAIEGSSVVWSNWPVVPALRFGANFQ